jgi:hypothetical protein
MCGWAHGEPGGMPIHGVHKLASEIYSAKALNLEGFLIGMIKGNGISRVYAEKPILPMVTSFDSMMSMAGIAAVIGMTCARIGADFFFVDQQSWRSEFLGTTQAPKMSDDQILAALAPGSRRDLFASRMYATGLAEEELKWVKSVRSEVRRNWLKNHTIEACRKRGVEPEDDNAADAVGIFFSKSDAMIRRDSTPQLDLLGGLTI